VAPWTATLGGNSQLRTLDGTVRVKVPAGSSSGRHIRLAGKGFPRPLGGAGDLYATIRIVVPEHPTPEERELLEKLAAVTQFTPGAQHAPAANGDDRRSTRAG
jgi:curved DNA-binding protein